MSVLSRFLDADFRDRCSASAAGDYLPTAAELTLGMPLLRLSMKADIVEAAKRAIRADDETNALAGRMIRSSPLYESLFQLMMAPSRSRMLAVLDACRRETDGECAAEIYWRMRVYLGLIGDCHSATEVTTRAVLESASSSNRRVAFALAAVSWGRVARLSADGIVAVQLAAANDEVEALDEVATYYTGLLSDCVEEHEVEFRLTFAEVPHA